MTQLSTPRVPAERDRAQENQWTKLAGPLNGKGVEQEEVADMKQ